MRGRPGPLRGPGGRDRPLCNRIEESVRREGRTLSAADVVAVTATPAADGRAGVFREATVLQSNKVNIYSFGP